MNSMKMKIDDNELSPKKKYAIILMARGASIKKTAEEINCTEQTIYNWKTNDRFLEDLKDETRSYLDESRTRIASLAIPAIETLAELLYSGNDGIRLKAATEIMKSNGLNSLDPKSHAIRGIGLETPLSEDQKAENDSNDIFSCLKDLHL